MSMNCWTIFKDSLTLLIAFSVARIGLRTYKKNAKTRRAELIFQLHDDFFAEGLYKEVREKLDNSDSPPTPEEERYCEEQPEEFIQFLNFFELVAYLESSKVLKLKDVMAMFSYYLKLLNRREAIRRYISNTEKYGFKHLDRLLAKIAQRGEVNG